MDFIKSNMYGYCNTGFIKSNTGWWLVVEPTPLKNMLVSWDYYSLFSVYGQKEHVPNHQP